MYFLMQVVYEIGQALRDKSLLNQIIRLKVFAITVKMAIS